MIEAAKVIVPIGQGEEVKARAIAAGLQAFTESYREDSVDDSPVQRLLGREVAVHGPFAHARVLGDLAKPVIHLTEQVAAGQVDVALGEALVDLVDVEVEH